MLYPLKFWVSVRQRPHHSSADNSSYSFRPTLQVLLGWSDAYCFFQNPKIIFYHIFCIFNLDFFRALILQKCIGSMYLLHTTPPTVLGKSFSNFIGTFRMVWRYAYCFFRILKLFFITFFAFLTDFFRALILQKCIGSMYLLPATPPTVLSQSFSWSEGMHIVFSESWNYFFITFFAFLTDFFRALILQKCIGSMYLLPATPPTVLGQYFSNFTGPFRMVWRCAYFFLSVSWIYFL